MDFSERGMVLNDWPFLETKGVVLIHKSKSGEVHVSRLSPAPHKQYY
jgi:hypothetical protein